jgi:hypothetical protein
VPTLFLGRRADYEVAMADRTGRFLRILVLAGAASTGGCGGLEAALTQTGGDTVADTRLLDGRFAGIAASTFESDRCARQLRLAIVTANGRLTGEVSDPRQPGLAPTPFEGYLDTDGAVAARVRAFGEVFVLRGRVRETRFEGRLDDAAGVDPARNNPRPGDTNLRFGNPLSFCGWVMRLPRQRA